MTRVSRVVAVLVGITGLFLVLRFACERPSPPQPVTPPDTLAAAAWRSRSLEADRRYAAAAHELSGARGLVAYFGARLRDEQAIKATIRTVYDTTFIPVHDTIGFRTEISGGKLTLEVGIPVGDSGKVRPASTAPVDVRYCDDALRITGLRIICDKPRFGHLSLIPRIGVDGPLLPPSTFSRDLLSGFGELALRWTPAYRSPWAVEVTAQGSPGRSRLMGTVERGFHIW